MESIIQWNRGHSIENILRKIYTKYIYRGSNTNEIDILYGNVSELLNNANTENELLELESIVSSLLADGKIDGKEYNYLINAINDKKKEL